MSVERTIFLYYLFASRWSLNVFVVVLVDACARGKENYAPGSPLFLVLGLLVWLKGLISEL